MSSLVLTIKNDEQRKVLCRKIGQNFYLIGRDVFMINGKYYKESLTFVDHYDGIRKLKSEHYVHNAYTDASLSNTCYTTKTILVSTGNRGDTNPVCESAKNSLVPSWFSSDVYVPKNLSVVYPVRRNHKYYGCNDNPNYERVLESSLETTTRFSAISKELEELTFGFEIESSDGEIIENIVNQFKFVKLYDGSITGHEFVSIPLKVDNFHYVEQFCNLLQKACIKNMFCSTHIHLGGIPYSPENFTSIFSLFKRLEHEIHAIVPPYKKSLNYFVNKRNNGLGEIKDHCKYLPDHVDLALGSKNPKGFTQQLAQYFSNGRNIDLSHLGTTKYKDLFEGRKWNLNRYFFVNFVNYLFKKEGTIEFRLLESTFCFENILYWLLLNVAIVKYAIKEQTKVFARKDKITLEDCVYGIYSEEVAFKITEWISSRKYKFSKYLNTQNDFSSDTWFTRESDTSSIKW